jgi:hypothetical protein
LYSSQCSYPSRTTPITTPTKAAMSHPFIAEMDTMSPTDVVWEGRFRLTILKLTVVVLGAWAIFRVLVRFRK